MTHKLSKESVQKNLNRANPSVDWKLADAFPMLSKKNEEDNFLLTKMDSLRLSATCTMSERLAYTKFWCCLAEFMKVKNVAFTEVQLWFKMETYETDCYWFELLFHLSIVAGELLRILPDVHLSKHPVLDVSLITYVKTLIGCCVYMESFGMQFDKLDSKTYYIVKDTYSALLAMKHKIRIKCLFWLATSFYKDEQYSDAYLFITAYLAEDIENKSAIILQARAASTLALEQGFFSDAIRILKSCKDLEKEANILSESVPVCNSTTSDKVSFQPPRCLQKLLAVGENPLLSPMFSRLVG